jgi:hypothetical protein
MNYGDEEYDLHENCVSTDDAVPYVFENHWEEVEEAVADAHAREWLIQSRPCLELLSIVSQRDREHMREATRKWLRKKETDGHEPTEEQLFSIAADVSSFLEQLQSSFPPPPVVYSISPDHGYQGSQEPTAVRCLGFTTKACTIGGDFSWAKDLLIIMRAFRDLVSAASDDFEQTFLILRARDPIQIFNNYLRRAPADLLVYWLQKDDKALRFGRCPDPEFSYLSSYIANWIASYLEKHYLHIHLAACAECGKFFVRERRDKTFCSKTCQNRVAYKRKKILESSALAEVNIPPDDACDIAAGLWMYHPRFGIGRIESASSASRPSLALPRKSASAVDEVKYRSMLSRKIVLQVRFLHGMRAMKYSDLFEGRKKEDQLPTFYEVKSEETLAELL